MLAAPVRQSSSPQLGAIGVDINADHLAIAETDRFGNMQCVHRLDAITYGKSQDQTKAILGDAANEIARMAQRSGKPVALETLDFTKKKAELETAKVDRSRSLSAFAYGRTVHKTMDKYF